MPADDLRGRLLRDGFCVVSRVLDIGTLGELRAAADRLGERWSERAGRLYRAEGSMVDVSRMRDPVFGRLIALPAALSALDGMGLGNATFTDGYVISKPPHSPRLFWHFDWFGWDDETAYQAEPLQVFLMYYLTDTRPQNGCLRVIPGSHRRRHHLHDVMADGHAELHTADQLDRPEFDDVADEVDVTVEAGDLVVGDARLLHAAHANDTDERRSLVTLWYQPHAHSLPPRVQATLAAKLQALPDTWPDDVRAPVEGLQLHYDGDAIALPRTITGPRRVH